MRNKNATETLKETVEEIRCILDEIQTLEEMDDFIYGEKTAYVEYLEWLQELCGKSEEYGLDFDIEENYPL